MSWVRLDDHFPTHPKMVAAGGDAGWLHVCALCYCAEHLTDGRLPKAVVSRLSDRKSPMRLAARLVEVGSWADDGDCFVINDFLVYNRSREQVEKEREAARERRSKDGQRSADVRANAARDSDERRENDINPDPTRPDVPTERGGRASAPRRGSRIPDEFILTAEMRAWARNECPDVDVNLTTKRFVAYWKGESGAKASKRDWNQAWRNWLLKDQGDVKKRGAGRTHL